MMRWGSVGGVLACGLLLLTAGAGAQESAQPGGAQHPGRAVVMSKCFQCHTDAMFRDQRQDRRGWEATIYRMVGRGGLWSAEEIKLMADYLGSELGPKSSNEKSSTDKPSNQPK